MNIFSKIFPRGTFEKKNYQNFEFFFKKVGILTVMNIFFETFTCEAHFLKKIYQKFEIFFKKCVFEKKMSNLERGGAKGGNLERGGAKLSAPR